MKNLILLLAMGLVLVYTFEATNKITDQVDLLDNEIKKNLSNQRNY